MANHQSTKKRIRQIAVRRDSNKYYAKTARNALKIIRASTNKEEAGVLLPKITSMLDKLAKKNILHKKKASNLKSSLAKHVQSL